MEGGSGRRPYEVYMGSPGAVCMARAQARKFHTRHIFLPDTPSALISYVTKPYKSKGSKSVEIRFHETVVNFSFLHVDFAKLSLNVVCLLVCRVSSLVSRGFRCVVGLTVRRGPSLVSWLSVVSWRLLSSPGFSWRFLVALAASWPQNG